MSFCNAVSSEKQFLDDMILSFKDWLPHSGGRKASAFNKRRWINYVEFELENDTLILNKDFNSYLNNVKALKIPWNERLILKYGYKMPGVYDLIPSGPSGCKLTLHPISLADRKKLDLINNLLNKSMDFHYDNSKKESINYYQSIKDVLTEILSREPTKYEISIIAEM